MLDSFCSGIVAFGKSSTLVLTIVTELCMVSYLSEHCGWFSMYVGDLFFLCVEGFCPEKLECLTVCDSLSSNFREVVVISGCHTYL